MKLQLEEIYFLFLAIGPITSGFVGFLIARQLRALDATPFVGLLFGKYRWLFSLLMGLGLGGIYSIIVFGGSEFQVWNIVRAMALCLAISISYHLGTALGWKPMGFGEEKLPSTAQVPLGSLPNNLTLEDMPQLVRISIKTNKRWVWFFLALFQFVIFALVTFFLGGLVLVALLQNFLPESLRFLSWIMAGGVVKFLIYKNFQGVIEYVFDTEVIEINHEGIMIEKSGLGFRDKKRYPADAIKHLASLFVMPSQYQITRRSPFSHSLPVFSIWLNRSWEKTYSFGRTVDLADAQNILEIIYNRFPQYKPASSVPVRSVR